MRKKPFTRWVLAFVNDIRNIPKKTELRHRELEKKGVRIWVYDIDFNEEEVKRYKVPKAPYYIIMQHNKQGFNDGMFNEAYPVRRYRSLSSVENAVPWILSGT